MFFTLSKVLWFLADPGNLLLIALVVGVVLLWTRWRAAGRAVLTLALAGAVFFSVVPIGSWLFADLENRFPVVDQPPERVDGIVVLGGVLSQKITRDRGQITVNDAVERLLAFAQLAQRYPTATLVFSGGSGSLLNQDLKEAHFVAPLLARLGVDPGRVLFEDRARNTAENATFSHALADPQPGETWLLITSAFHMPRAVGCFRRAGWTVVPYPVDFHTTGPADEISVRFNFLSGLGSFRAALHEWLGLLAYWLTDRTDTLLPGPQA